jgi:hypothetical protein
MLVSGLDAPLLTPSFGSPSLAPLTFQLPSTGLDSCVDARLFMLVSVHERLLSRDLISSILYEIYVNLEENKAARRLWLRLQQND